MYLYFKYIPLYLTLIDMNGREMKIVERQTEVENCDRNTCKQIWKG